MHTTINSQKVEKIVWGYVYVHTYVILPTKVHVVKAVIFSIVIGLLVVSNSHWKRPRCWERLKPIGEEGSRV